MRRGSKVRTWRRGLAWRSLGRADLANDRGGGINYLAVLELPPSEARPKLDAIRACR